MVKKDTQVECPPESLYKYRSLADNTKQKWVGEIFEKQSLYLNDPTSFNDPFDCYPIFQMPKTNQEIEEYAEKLVRGRNSGLNRRGFRREVALWEQKLKNSVKDQSLFDSLKADTRQIVHDYRVFCLSASPKSILMWSHYAENHKGICLEFTARRGTTFWKHVREVKYQTERPYFNPAWSDDHAKYNNLFLRKSCDWEYEKEWRIVQEKKTGETLGFCPTELTGVILGAKISQDHEEKIREWVREYPADLQIKKARMSESRYKIEFADDKNT